MFREGTIQVTLPRCWPLALKKSVTEVLVGRVVKSQQKQQVQQARLLAHPAVAQASKITLTDVKSLHQYVMALNQQTFQAPLKGVRIGSARYSRLAQLNTRTGMVTISRYSLQNVPEPALRYLVIHELAHFLEANHSRRFWAQVARFVPDYRLQSQIMKAFHQLRVQESLESLPSLAVAASNDKP